MRKVVVLLVLCASGGVRAEECDDLCKPLAPVEKMDPQVREELYTGLGLLAAGHIVGLFAQLRLPTSAAERTLATIPVFGAIEGAARSGDQWEIRMTLVFSAGVQIVGALLAATAWGTREDHPSRLGFSGDGTVHF